MQQLSLAARPKTLTQLVGQEKIVKEIRGIIAEAIKNNGMPKAWLFSGPTGTGKTSIARILALSYQCTHQNGEWGVPCKECYGRYSDFNIFEIPASEITGKAEIQDALKGSDYGPFAGSQYRIYILDELHRMSVAAQSLTLKYLEDSPETTIFILCSTHPQNVLETLRGRCKGFSLKELDDDAVLLLVSRLLKRLKSPLPADRLTDSLVEKGIRYPRLICHAVEKYIGGSNPDDAAVVDVVNEVDTKNLTRSLIKGDWQSVSKYMLNAQTVDTKSIRLGVIGYLRVVLLESPDISDSTKAVAQSLEYICNLQNMEDLSMSAALTAQLYKLCAVFSKYPR